MIGFETDGEAEADSSLDEVGFGFGSSSFVVEVGSFGLSTDGLSSFSVDTGSFPFTVGVEEIEAEAETEVDVGLIAGGLRAGIPAKFLSCTGGSTTTETPGASAPAPVPPAAGVSSSGTGMDGPVPPTAGVSGAG